MPREVMEYDVVIVGAGPSGLAAAIRLRQLGRERGAEARVCVIEKGAEVGAHILSGAVIEPRALAELFPDWKERGAPLKTPAADERFWFLTARRAWRLPVPPPMRNRGNYVVSLGNLCRWLAREAEEMGVDIFPGFAAAGPLFHPDGSLRGVATGDMGVGKDGRPTANHQPGVDLAARQTLIAEGCRGSLAKVLFEKFNLRGDADPQTYGIGLKELWEVAPARHRPGLVTHSVGWPLDGRTYGGSFLYHLEDNQVAVGLVVGLDYENPHLSPFDEFQRFKTHPAIRPTFEGGRRIAFGARALSEGGLQSVPKLTFPGGMLVGDAAGFLNAPKIKGVHTAMKSGMVAAETVFAALAEGRTSGETGVEIAEYAAALSRSWVWAELKRARNIRPAFRWGMWPGMAYAALEAYLLRGRAPWTLRHHRPDHEALKPADRCRKIDYPKPDGRITFDKPSSVYLSGVNHEENQPLHLRLRDPETPVAHNLEIFEAPEQRYCPAGVYEMLTDAEGGNPHLQINAQNCIHCKACDIKDPTQNIDWTTPEGGGGPNYPNM